MSTTKDNQKYVHTVDSSQKAKTWRHSVLITRFSLTLSVKQVCTGKNKIPEIL